MAHYKFWFKLLFCLTTVLLLLFLSSLPAGYFQYHVPQHDISIKGHGFPNSSTDHTTDARAETDLHATHGFSLTLVIRMAAVPKLVERLYCIFLRSATVFWSPKLGPISLILDKESERDHQFADKMRKHENELGLKFDFSYEPYPKSASGWKPKGYQRQIWNSFFMDLYVNASVIGWTDTDMVFTTPVTPENIFNGNRLRVPTIANIDRLHKWGVYNMVLKATGKGMVSNYGTTFPLYLWRDTLTNCRNHVMKHMNVSTFEDAFRKIPGIAPNNIIYTYAYYFEHDRYDWHMDFIETLEEYNAKLDAGVSADVSETEPDVLVSIHQRYYEKGPNPLLQGYCVAKRHVSPLPAIASCSAFQTVTNFQLFEFLFCKDYYKLTHFAPGAWCSGNNGSRDCIRRIEAHYRNVKKYYKLGWYDLDFSRITAVEEIARRENAKCPKIF